MTVEVQAELEAFHRFVGEQLRAGQGNLSPEQSVAAFRAYQRDLQRLRQDLQKAVAQSERGKSQPLDADVLKQKVRERLADHGIQ